MMIQQCITCRKCFDCNVCFVLCYIYRFQNIYLSITLLRHPIFCLIIVINLKSAKSLLARGSTGQNDANRYTKCNFQRVLKKAQYLNWNRVTNCVCILLKVTIIQFPKCWMQLLRIYGFNIEELLNLCRINPTEII